MVWLEIFAYSLAGLTCLGILFQGTLVLIENVLELKDK